MIFILDEDPIEGYLAGWDDDTYFIVYTHENQVFKELIPHANILKILLFDESSFREEPLYEEMNLLVRPFRDMINAVYYSGKSE